MWRFLDQYLSSLLIKLIKLYQKSLSLDHSWLKFLKPYGQCRFRPTCSEYAILAIKKYGTIKGGLISAKRLLKCNPFHPGGYDPVE